MDSAARSAADTYPPLADYAAIGDCRSAALVARDGSVDWLCWPDFDSAAIFAALLDRASGGFFRICPLDVESVQRRYLDGTNVLETTFHTTSGTLRLTDAMNFGGSHQGELAPERELLRIAEVIEGRVTLAVDYAPRPGYGARPPRLRSAGHAVVFGNSAELLYLHTSTALDFDRVTATASGRIRMTEGEKHYFSLAYVAGDIGVLPPLGIRADARLNSTVTWWQDWTSEGDWSVPFAPYVQRSALVLKMLDFALSGAIVAAPTTSLPEVVGGARNWDYRFCWLRDASLTLRAFMELGYVGESRAFLDWLLHTTRLTRPRLRVLYDLYGRAGRAERVLEHLDGYRDSRPVRTGNGASGQLQLDIYGAVCLAALKYVQRGGGLERAEKRMLAGFGRIVIGSWRQPDNGIWEIRDTREHHSYSKLMCWAALDSLLRLDEHGGMPIDRRRIAGERDEIRAWLDSHAYSKAENAFVARPGADWPDVSMLAMARCGFLEANDPRMIGTWEFLERRLGKGALMYRYPPRTDGLPGSEGTFGLAAFWVIEYLARCGRVDDALDRFQALLGYANDLGLYSEEIDADTGELLGNFPQAFTHIALINAACSLRDAMQEERQ